MTQIIFISIIFIQNNKVRYRYGVKFVKIDLSVVKEEKKFLDKSSKRFLRELLLLLVDWPGVGVDELVVALHVVTVLVGPLQPVVPFVALGAHPDGVRLSDQPSFPRPSCSRLVTGFAFLPQAPYGLVGGVELELLNFKIGCPRHQVLKSRQLQRGASTRCSWMMVAGIRVGMGVGLGRVMGGE